jgi:hypothetical protein
MITRLAGLKIRVAGVSRKMRSMRWIRFYGLKTAVMMDWKWFENRGNR